MDCSRRRRGLILGPSLEVCFFLFPYVRLGWGARACADWEAVLANSSASASATASIASASATKSSNAAAGLIVGGGAGTAAALWVTVAMLGGFLFGM